MGKCFLHGNGGAGLNFKVEAYKSVSELPDTADANTIAVFTEHMTGYSFDPTEPENAAEGLVWFKTGNYSIVAFDALEDNSMRICPIGVAQYVGGAWKEIEAKTYQGGWIDWKFDLYLIQNGIYNEAVFGKTTTDWAQIKEDGITLSAYNHLTVSNFVDFTKYGSVEIDVKTFNHCDLQVQFLDSAGSIAIVISLGVNGTGKFAADMTNVNGSYRVKFYGRGNNEIDNVVFDNVRFIPW